MSYSVCFRLCYFSVGFNKYCGVNIVYNNKLCCASLAVSSDGEHEAVLILTVLAAQVHIW